MHQINFFTRIESAREIKPSNVSQRQYDHAHLCTPTNPQPQNACRSPLRTTNAQPSRFHVSRNGRIKTGSPGRDSNSRRRVQSPLSLSALTCNIDVGYRGYSRSACLRFLTFRKTKAINALLIIILTPAVMIIYEGPSSLL